MAKDSIDKATDRQIAEIDKELNEMYARAALEIREKSEDFAREFEKKDAKKRKLVEEGKLDKAEYERWRNTQIFQSENYKQLENNIAAEMANTNQTAIDYVNGELPKTYAQAYNGFGAGIASVAVGYDFALLNNDSLIALSEVEAKKLNVPKDTAWTNKKIRAEVAQGIAQGESTTAIAKRFEKIGASEGAAAKRLARTMIGGAQNGGKQAAMQRASASGIIMGKQWKAFHDARTRDSHIMLDNEIVAVDDAFSNGCRYPRDPEGAPGEICNCRCGMSGKVMGFRHADGSVTMVDMSVNCTEMPEGVFPPGYTYSQWKQDAQNRITAKQLREEELAAAENPGYGNSLLQKGRNSVTISSPISGRGLAGKPSAMHIFNAPLNNRQKGLLKQLKNEGDRLVTKKSDIKLSDLAALTSATGVEFALFTREGERLIVRGGPENVPIYLEDARKLKDQGYKWSGHTHIYVDALIASDGDYEILKAFGQKRSALYTPTGRFIIFEVD